VLIFGWKVIVFVIAVSKSCVFAVSPVVDLVFIIENDTEVASSCDSLNVLAFEGFDFGGLRYDLRDIYSMPCRSCRVHKQFHQHIQPFPSEAPCVYFSFLCQSYSVALSSHYILDCYVVLSKVVDQFGLLLILGVTVAKLSVRPRAEGVDVAELKDRYPDSPMATMWSTPTDAL
jgi:hypothetical protein